MAGLAWFCLVVMGVFALIVGLYLLVSWLCRDRHGFRRDAPLSILVAARDEEDAIEDCLRALDSLNYPKTHLQILIGDDDSSDRTAEVVQRFIADKPWFRYVRISDPVGHLRGKQNVLAQLAAQATGEFLLITDADIRVHPDWAAGMAAVFDDPEVGVACGPTLVNGAGIFAHMQALDWLMGQVLARAHSCLGIPITAVGNNMAVRKSAYDGAGGYAGMPFSIVEDYILFQTLCERGPWRFVQRFHTGVSATSLPLPDMRAWTRQRKRWFAGARGLAWYNVALILFNALVLPALVLAAFVLPGAWFAGLVLLKLLADLGLLFIGALRLKRLGWLGWFLPYEAYYVLSLVLTPILMLSPARVIWKGRRY